MNNEAPDKAVLDERPRSFSFALNDIHLFVEVFQAKGN